MGGALDHKLARLAWLKQLKVLRQSLKRRLQRCTNYIQAVFWSFASLLSLSILLGALDYLSKQLLGTGPGFLIVIVNRQLF